jgi:hypothetical protein
VKISPIQAANITALLLGLTLIVFFAWMVYLHISSNGLVICIICLQSVIAWYLVIYLHHLDPQWFLWFRLLTLASMPIIGAQLIYVTWKAQRNLP